jgi:hypothetical protein
LEKLVASQVAGGAGKQSFDKVGLADVLGARGQQGRDHPDTCAAAIEVPLSSM